MDNTPGVVVATLNNKEDKDEIMRAKSCLKRFRLYKKVFVDHDKCREQRNMEANLRLLVNIAAKDSLIVHGSRIIQKAN